MDCAIPIGGPASDQSKAAAWAWLQRSSSVRAAAIPGAPPAAASPPKHPSIISNYTPFPSHRHRSIDDDSAHDGYFNHNQNSCRLRRRHCFSPTPSRFKLQADLDVDLDDDSSTSLDYYHDQSAAVDSSSSNYSGDPSGSDTYSSPDLQRRFVIGPSISHGPTIHHDRIDCNSSSPFRRSTRSPMATASTGSSSCSSRSSVNSASNNWRSPSAAVFASDLAWDCGSSLFDCFELVAMAKNLKLDDGILSFSSGKLVQHPSEDSDQYSVGIGGSSWPVGHRYAGDAHQNIADDELQQGCRDAVEEEEDCRSCAPTSIFSPFRAPESGFPNYIRQLKGTETDQRYRDDGYQNNNNNNCSNQINVCGAMKSTPAPEEVVHNVNVGRSPTSTDQLQLQSVEYDVDQICFDPTPATLAAEVDEAYSRFDKRYEAALAIDMQPSFSSGSSSLFDDFELVETAKKLEESDLMVCRINLDVDDTHLKQQQLLLRPINSKSLDIVNAADYHNLPSPNLDNRIASSSWTSRTASPDQVVRQILHQDQPITIAGADAINLPTNPTVVHRKMPTACSSPINNNVSYSCYSAMCDQDQDDDRGAVAASASTIALPRSSDIDEELEDIDEAQLQQMKDNYNGSDASAATRGMLGRVIRASMKSVRGLLKPKRPSAAGDSRSAVATAADLDRLSSCDTASDYNSFTAASSSPCGSINSEEILVGRQRRRRPYASGDNRNTAACTQHGDVHHIHHHHFHYLLPPRPSGESGAGAGEQQLPEFEFESMAAKSAAEFEASATASNRSSLCVNQIGIDDDHGYHPLIFGKGASPAAVEDAELYRAMAMMAGSKGHRAPSYKRHSLQSTHRLLGAYLIAPLNGGGAAAAKSKAA